MLPYSNLRQPFQHLWKSGCQQSSKPYASLKWQFKDLKSEDRFITVSFFKSICTVLRQNHGNSWEVVVTVRRHSGDFWRSPPPPRKARILSDFIQAVRKRSMSTLQQTTSSQSAKMSWPHNPEEKPPTSFLVCAYSLPQLHFRWNSQQIKFLGLLSWLKPDQWKERQ